MGCCSEGKRLRYARVGAGRPELAIIIIKNMIIIIIAIIQVGRH